MCNRQRYLSASAARKCRSRARSRKSSIACEVPDNLVRPIKRGGGSKACTRQRWQRVWKFSASLLFRNRAYTAAPAPPRLPRNQLLALHQQRSIGRWKFNCFSVPVDDRHIFAQHRAQKMTNSQVCLAGIKNERPDSMALVSFLLSPCKRRLQTSWHTSLVHQSSEASATESAISRRKRSTYCLATTSILYRLATSGTSSKTLV